MWYYMDDVWEGPTKGARVSGIYNSVFRKSIRVIDQTVVSSLLNVTSRTQIQILVVEFRGIPLVVKFKFVPPKDECEY